MSLIVLCALMANLELPVKAESTAVAAHKGRAVLYALPHARSHGGLPAGYRVARQTFDAAVADYQGGAPENCGPRFMQVATLLKAPGKQTTYSEAFQRMREIAYNNALICFTESKQEDAARKALSKAQQQDPANAGALKGLLTRLK